ncbi:MAG TPA: cyclic beta 1-2 glucan synthetase, partial [Treponemataceae bacterium]|nr:cyclic beta 1-2 glucan synthetase [Treponemataceae bacterium]
FSNLFVQTEIVRPYQAIVCSRRPRSDQDSFPLVLHLMAVHGNTTSGASYETDRAKFIGRLGSLANPAAMRVKTLSDSEGPVLDPIVSIRCTVLLEAQESAVIDYVTGICDTMEDAKKLMEKFRDRNLTDRVFSLAWTQGQVALQQINATEADAQLYGRLSGAIVYANPAWRAAPSILKKNLRGQSDLWGYGISGDLPIVLARIEDPENIGLIAQLMQAHSYWRMKGLRVDFVIWNEDHSVYRDEMSEKINVLITKHGAGMSNQPGGVFLRRADQMSEEDKILMQTVARAIISDRGGSLSEQLERVVHPRTLRPPLATSKWPGLEYTEESPSERTDLEYFNGLGGFTKDGREYVINTGSKGRTPAPWVNVLANKDFGTVVSESGSAYTWSENAHEFRLTPWKNDAVTDACGEALYIRDEESGAFWSPTPLPAGGDGAYVSRHGFGYSVFEHGENGIETELTVFVSLDQPVKFAVLKLRNQSGKRRSLSASAYYELVMGTQREKYHMHIITEVDPKSGAMLAYNHYNKEFPDRVAFLDTSETVRFVSGDRNEFLGSNGSMKNPAAMQRDRLSGMTGAGFDPCLGLQVKFELEDNDEKTIAFTFGSGKSLDEARGILLRFGGTPQIHRELERVWEYWKRRLGVVYVETPDDSVNFLVNGWLQYQTLSCRLWGRSGYYQSGGAYGFRDQLQDVMSLMHSYPEMVRELNRPGIAGDRKV